MITLKRLGSVFLLFVLVTWAVQAIQAPTAQAQTEAGIDWLAALEAGQISIDRLENQQLGSVFPVLTAEVTNQTGQPLALTVAPGQILTPLSSRYCSLLQRGSERPVTLPANSTGTLEIGGYCLESDLLQPELSVSYLPITSSQATLELQQLLERAREANLLGNMATQLAIWTVYQNISVDELAQQLAGAPINVEAHRQRIAYLRGEGVLEEPTPLPTESPTPTQEPDIVAPAPTESSPIGEATIAPVATNAPETTTPLDIPLSDALLFVLGGVLVLTVALAIFFYVRNRRRTVSPRPIPSHNPAATSSEASPPDSSPLIPPPTLGQAPPANVGDQNLYCSVCKTWTDHTYKTCPRTQDKARQPFAGRPGRLATRPRVSSEPEPYISPGQRPAADGGVSPGPARPVGGRTSSGGPTPQPTPQRAAPSIVPSPRVASTDDGQSRRFTQPVVGGASSARTEPAGADGSNIERIEPAVVPTVIYHIRQKEGNNWREIGKLGGSGGVLGRADWEMNQFVLMDKVGQVGRLGTVSSPHALIEVWDNNGVKEINLRDLNSLHQTWLNNDEVPAGRHPLQQGDLVRFGKADEYEVDLRGRQLLNLSGGANIPLPASGKATMITRLWVRSVRLTDNKQLSDPHLLLYPDGERPLNIVIRDLHSSNGTVIINGQATRLNDEENKQFIAKDIIELQIGQTRYQIEVTSQDKPGLIGQYEVVKQFNRGGVCYVYLVKDPQTGEQFVAKVPNLKQYDRAEHRQNALVAFKNECQLLQEAANEQLVNYIEANSPDESDKPYLIIQYVPPAADLAQIQDKMREAGQRMPLKQVKKILQSLIAALAHLHTKDWGHCDVKPSNILIRDDGRVYLIDLGSATRFGETANFVTDYYSAPEARNGHAIYAMADIYSVGVILFELLTAVDASKLNLGTRPRLDSQPRTSAVGALSALSTIGNLDELFQQAPAFAQGFKHIVAKCLPNQPDERYRDMAELLEALEDAYNMEPIARELEQDGPELDSLVARFASKPV